MSLQGLPATGARSPEAGGGGEGIVGASSSGCGGALPSGQGSGPVEQLEGGAQPAGMGSGGWAAAGEGGSNMGQLGWGAQLGARTRSQQALRQAQQHCHALP